VDMRICRFGLVLLVVASVVCGCGRSSPAAKRSFSVANDRAAARRLLDRVYAGSLSPIKSEVDSPFLRGNPDRLTLAASAALTRQFGSIQDLKLKAVERGVMDSAAAMWTVIATRGTYDAKVAIDDNGKVAGLWFRSSSSQPWVPSHAVGTNSVL
jgi:alkaline phosphatase